METSKTLALSNKLMLLVPLIVIFAIVLIGFTIRKSISSSMKVILKDFELSTNGDLRQRVRKFNNDEIGTIGNYLSQMNNNISKIISGVKIEGSNISSIGETLHNNMETNATAIELISTNMAQIDEHMDLQKSEVAKSKSAVTEIVNRIEDLNFQIENQSASVAQSSSSIEEMVANIGSVNKILQNNSDSVNKLKKSFRFR